MVKKPADNKSNGTRTELGVMASKLIRGYRSTGNRYGTGGQSGQRAWWL